MPKGIYKNKESNLKRLKHLKQVRYQKPITKNIISLNKIRKEKKFYELCKSIKNLQLHHIIPAQYNKNWYYISDNHKKENIQILCSSCYQKLHYNLLSRKVDPKKDPKTGRWLKCSK